MVTYGFLASFLCCSEPDIVESPLNTQLTLYKIVNNIFLGSLSSTKHY